MPPDGEREEMVAAYCALQYGAEALPEMPLSVSVTANWSCQTLCPARAQALAELLKAAARAATMQITNCRIIHPQRSGGIKTPSGNYPVSGTSGLMLEA